MVALLVVGGRPGRGAEHADGPAARRAGWPGGSGRVGYGVFLWHLLVLDGVMSLLDVPLFGGDVLPVGAAHRRRQPGRRRGCHGLLVERPLLDRLSRPVSSQPGRAAERQGGERDGEQGERRAARPPASASEPTASTPAASSDRRPAARPIAGATACTRDAPPCQQSPTGTAEDQSQPEGEHDRLPAPARRRPSTGSPAARTRRAFDQREDHQHEQRKGSGRQPAAVPPAGCEVQPDGHRATGRQHPALPPAVHRHRRAASGLRPWPASRRSRPRRGPAATPGPAATVSTRCSAPRLTVRTRRPGTAAGRSPRVTWSSASTADERASSPGRPAGSRTVGAHGVAGRAAPETSWAGVAATANRTTWPATRSSGPTRAGRGATARRPAAARRAGRGRIRTGCGWVSPGALDGEPEGAAPVSGANRLRSRCGRRPAPALLAARGHDERAQGRPARGVGPQPEAGEGDRRPAG